MIYKKIKFLKYGYIHMIFGIFNLFKKKMKFYSFFGYQLLDYFKTFIN